MICLRASLYLLITYFLFPLCQSGTAQEDESLVLTFKKHKGAVYSISASPDGSTIASSGDDLLIHLWDRNSGEIRTTLEGYQKPVKYITFSHDGKYLLSAGGTEIRIWDLDDGGWTKYSKHVTHIYNLDFNRDATQFLSTSLKDKFYLWNREEASVIHAFEGHSKTILAAAFSPNNQWIASGSLDQTVILWDVKTRKPVHTMSAHGGNIFSLDFSPDSKLLASCSMDENIKIWNVETGKIHKLLTGHDYAVVFVRFSPNGRYLISASYDMTAKLWEVATGNCIYTFVDHADALYAADFVPDGSQIISCSNDGTVRIYEMSPRFAAEYYYFNEIEKEMEASGLFEPRRRGEPRDAYKARREKASGFRMDLFDKYYRKHLSDLEQQNP
jgi:WD40 repeat protein